MRRWLEFPSPQVPGRPLARFGGPPGNPAAFFELDHVVLPDAAIVGQRHREHLTRAAHALPGGCAGQIVVPVPARLLSWVRDQLEDPLRPGRDLAAPLTTRVSSCAVVMRPFKHPATPARQPSRPRPATATWTGRQSKRRAGAPKPSGRRPTLTKRDQPRNAKARTSPPFGTRFRPARQLPRPPRNGYSACSAPGRPPRGPLSRKRRGLQPFRMPGCS